MSYKIKTMNKISDTGLSLFGSKYSISDDEASPDAIVVRSAKVATDDFDGLLAVARAGAGTNNVTIEEASKKGVCVFNTPGANANAVSELVFGSLSMALRNVHKALEYTATLKEIDSDEEITKLVEKNKSLFAGSETAGKTMGVIGLGKIGVLVANGAIARNMKVIAFEPYPNVDNMHMLNSNVEVTSELGDVMSKADVISLHVPLMDATKGLINSESLKTFGNGGVILNFARGGIVDEASIIDALDSGKVHAYVTDFPNKSQIIHEKAICLPHLGASTAEAEENCATMAVDQVKDYLEYGIVRNSVNFPAVDGRPSIDVKTRLVVINEDVPHMIANISKVLGDADVNIQSFKNESNKKIGYNIIDVGVELDSSIVDSIKALQHVIKVRVIQF